MDLRDFGTTFKAYRAEVLKDVNLYGELHRFIPALASFYGARVAEVPIRNTPRAAGDSHYGIGRTFRVLFDILTIRFLLKYFTRPMHFFGSLGLAGTGLGGAILAYLPSRSCWARDRACEHGPLMMAGALLLLAGLMMFCTGLIGEVMMRTYFESQDRRIYAVREILTQKRRGASTNAGNDSVALVPAVAARKLSLVRAARVKADASHMRPGVSISGFASFAPCVKKV